MNRLLLGLALLMCLSIPACQCSNKPEIGPVEGTTAAVTAQPILPLIG